MPHTRPRKHRPAIPAVLLAAVLTASTVLAACQTTEPSPTPTDDLLYREAKTIFEKIRTEFDQIEAQGGTDELPETLDKLVADPLHELYTANYQVWKEKGFVSIGDPAKIAWIRRHHENRKESVIAITACVDGTGMQIQDRSGEIKPGEISKNIIYFKYFGMNLKAFSSNGDKDTKKC